MQQHTQTRVEHTVGEIIPVSHKTLIANVHFHSVWAVEMDTLPGGGDPSEHAVAEHVQSAPGNLFALWEKPHILEIVRVIG